jgi:hypothetical protein
MTTWEQTPAALMRGQGTPAPGSLASIPGRDSRPRAEQFPDAAAEHMAAWASDRWAFQTREHGIQYVDNAGVRAEQRRLAEEGPPVGWLDLASPGPAPRRAGAAVRRGCRGALAYRHGIPGRQ